MNFKPPEYNVKKIFKFTPDMWMNEIKYIEDLLRESANKVKKVRILEWGSGNSTLYFSLFMKAVGIDFEWHAIEHFIPWHKKVQTFIKEHGLQEQVFCHLKSATDIEDKEKQEQSDLSEYINLPKDLGKFDIILIDGRKRAECLKIASCVRSKDGYVILHDAERKQYHPGFKNYDGGFVLENISPNSQGGIQKLWIG